MTRAFKVNISAPSIIKDGGTSSQFLKADGSVDTATYLATGTAASTYLSISTASTTYAPLTSPQLFVPFIKRVDSASEGGQIDFARSLDNAQAWYLDVYGNTSTPSFRIVDTSNAAVRLQIDGTTGNVSAQGFVKNGGTSAQYLMADGSVTTGGASIPLTLTALSTGWSIAGGTTSKTLTLSNTLTLAGTDSSTLNIGSGGTLGTGAFATIANYAPLAGATFTGQIQSTLTGSPTSGAGQFFLNGATSNRVEFNGNGIAAPTFNTRSAGTKIILYPNIGPAVLDYAIGIDSGVFWQSVNDSTAQFKWYAGTTNISSLSGTGVLTASSFIPNSSTIPTNGIYLPATNSIGIATNSTNRITIDASGNFGIGTASPAAPLNIVGNFYSDTYTSGATNTFVARKARGTISAPTAVQSSDNIMSLTARGWGTTGFAAASTGAIQFWASENFTDSANGTYFTISTTPNGSVTRAERMRIDSSGNVGIGATPSGSYKLEVNGSLSGGIISATNYISSTNGAVIYGNAASVGQGKYNLIFKVTNTAQSTATAMMIQNATTARDPFMIVDQSVKPLFTINPSGAIYSPDPAKSSLVVKASPQDTVPITAITGDGTTVTYTISGINPFVPGQIVDITGATTTAYNLTNAIVDYVQANNFTVLNSATGTTSTATATPKVQTASIQEWQSSSSSVLSKIDISGNLTATSFVKTAGTSSQFLMADGSTSSTTSLDIIPLDDISNQINGQSSRFLPTYQGEKVTINNPLRLLVSINGIIQTVGFTDNTWQSFLPKDGFVVDNDGYIAFSEVLPLGSSFHGRLMAGSDTTSRTTTYPFRASDILLGE